LYRIVARAELLQKKEFAIPSCNIAQREFAKPS